MIAELAGISKSFGGVLALDGVDLAVREGGVHGLLGENGAGKTTLMNILFGYYRPDHGEIRIQGRKVAMHSPHDAIRMGIGMVHQLSTLVPEFSAVENIILGTKEERLSLRLDRESDHIRELSRKLGLDFPLGTKVKYLSAGVKQKIEIIRGLYKRARLIILDEPTTYLVESEFHQLLQSVRALVDQGITFIFITHKIREVLEACDTVTVLRKGKVEGTIDRQSMDPESLVKMMFVEKEIRITANALPRIPLPECTRTDKPVLSARELCVEAGEKGVGLDHVSFEVYGGEILGVASVSGNGEKQLVQASVCPSIIKGGDLLINDQSIRGLSTLGVFSRGAFYTPEERVKEGILNDGSIKENVLLGHHAEQRFIRHRWFVDWAEVQSAARKTIQEYGIHAPSENAPVRRLSGGNIQKVIIGRAFVSPLCLLITHNPTVGLDISSVQFVLRKLLDIRGSCGAVLWVNEDLDELMMLSDRIMVLHRGEVSRVFERAEFDKYQIGLSMIGAAS